MELYKNEMKVLLPRSLSLALRLSQIKLDQLQCSPVENKNDDVYPRELLWGQKEMKYPARCVLHTRFTAVVIKMTISGLSVWTLPGTSHLTLTQSSKPSEAEALFFPFPDEQRHGSMSATSTEDTAARRRANLGSVLPEPEHFLSVWGSPCITCSYMC